MLGNPIFKMKRHVDKFKKVYYTCKIDAPIIFDCSAGLSFKAFVSDVDAEELHIGRAKRPTKPMRNPKFIPMRACEDRDGQTFYAGTLTDYSNLDCRQGLFVKLFCSEPGREQLQFAKLEHHLGDDSYDDNDGDNDGEDDEAERPVASRHAGRVEHTGRVDHTEHNKHSAQEPIHT